jgi:hypothetical protein
MRGRDSARPPARWRCSTAKRCAASWRWVRGTVARMLSAQPRLTPYQVRSVLRGVAANVKMQM